MRDKHLFEYSVIRCVPRVEREEFLNVGVILYCRSQDFLQTRYEVNSIRLQQLCAHTDLVDITERLHAFEQICKGGGDAGPIGKLNTASRFRWLTANRSTIIQTSPVHPGFCSIPSETLELLFNDYVR